MAEKARDFRLDATLREVCKRDIEEHCLFEREAAALIPAGRCAVISCLQDWRHELLERECLAAVLATINRGSDDVRYTPAYQLSCEADYNLHCKGVQPVCFPTFPPCPACCSKNAKAVCRAPQPQVRLNL
jgi:hypothetical protein